MRRNGFGKGEKEAEECWVQEKIWLTTIQYMWDQQEVWGTVSTEIGQKDIFQKQLSGDSESRRWQREAVGEFDIDVSCPDSALSARLY